MWEERMAHNENGFPFSASPEEEEISSTSSLENLFTETISSTAAEELDYKGPNFLPVLPVRDVVIFNNMIIPLFIGREKSMRAVEAAMAGSRFLLVVAQKDESVEDPEPRDLHKTGTIVSILRQLKVPDARMKVLVQGIVPAKVDEFNQTDGYLSAVITPIQEQSAKISASVEALMRSVKEQSAAIFSFRGLASPEVIAILESMENPGRLADLVAANLRLKMEQAQSLLETENPVERLEKVHGFLSHELEVAQMQAKIQGAAKEGMEKAQKEFFLREQLKAIHNELGNNEFDSDEDLEQLKESLRKAGLTKEAQEEAAKQLRRLASMHNDSAEASIIRSWLELVAELPWKKQSKDRLDIENAKKILDEDHRGLEKVKDRILEFLSVRKFNPNSKGSILCLVGPPGVGKTSLGKSIARALGRKFQRFSLGGMRDEAEIRGHRRTYIGALPGRIIQALKQAGTRNPVIVLDEIDKIGADFRGDPSSALLEVLDPEQNSAFSDHYLNVPFDLSRIMFICTANHVDTIPGPLKDRMEIITLPGYTTQEKLDIAIQHLLGKQLEDSGFKENEITFTREALEKIIREYTREAGVRNLEREIGAICRKLARKKAEGMKEPYTVTPKNLQELLGAPKFLEDEKDNDFAPGMALGLAWTPTGGVVMNVEANALNGKGSLLLTGQLGDVMKESAQAALSYIRSRAKTLGVDPGFASKKDIHVHVPAGATPKDGPSAGITLTTALISALSGVKVRDDLCMTGEITLQGRVLPVGGIKEKILAGVGRDLKHVIIPYQNIKDLEEIPVDLKEKIEIHPVRHYDEVYPLVFAEEERKAAGKKKHSNPKRTLRPRNSAQHRARFH